MILFFILFKCNVNSFVKSLQSCPWDVCATLLWPLKIRTARQEFKQGTVKTLVRPKEKNNQAHKSGIARDKLKYIELFAFCNQIRSNEIKKKMTRVRSVKVMKSRGILSLPTAKKNWLENGKHFLREWKKRSSIKCLPSISFGRTHTKSSPELQPYLFHFSMEEESMGTISLSHTPPSTSKVIKLIKCLPNSLAP